MLDLALERTGLPPHELACRSTDEQILTTLPTNLVHLHALFPPLPCSFDLKQLLAFFAVPIPAIRPGRGDDLSELVVAGPRTHRCTQVDATVRKEASHERALRR